MRRLTIKKSRVLFCSWCRTLLLEDQPSWYILMKSNFDLSPKGQWVELELLGKTILAFILDEKSPLKKDGWKMFFWACSADCLDKLQATFKQSKKFLLQSFSN